MAGAERQASLFVEPTTGETPVVINDRCLVRTADGFRVVIVSGIVFAHYTSDDRMAEAYAMVNLVEQGWADQVDVARAFGCSTRSIRRHQRRFRAGGLSALGRAGGYPRGLRRDTGSRERTVRQLKEQGVATREIARRVGVTPKAVRQSLKRSGWYQPDVEQLPLLPPEGGDPNLSAFGADDTRATSGRMGETADQAVVDPLPRSFDPDPCDRRVDRLLAYLGVLDDAAPVFRAGTRVPHAGVLCALPALIDTGVVTIARDIYRSLGPASYGLRTTLVALLLMALLRIKRPEALKEHQPADLGRLLGLDRAFEVKTLRRKLTRLASVGRAAAFGQALARRWVADRGSAIGFLYVDGHVRVYHGHRALPKAHVARMRLSMPATTDYWVNDATGQPLFVVTAEANAGMVTMLPAVLRDVRTLIGPRRVTVVFDRGGYSPKLFLKLVAEGFDILTYRKGRTRRVPRARFTRQRKVMAGQALSYLLADQHVRLLRGTLRLRQVTLLKKNGHQTPILTSRDDLTAVEVAFRMFERWRQENFFKYLREEYALDALADYGVVPADPEREVPNPKRAALTATIKEARARFNELTAEYGADVFVTLDGGQASMRGLTTAHRPRAARLQERFNRILALEKRRAAMPLRVPVRTVVASKIVKLAPERKLLTNLIKMVAYQAESDLVQLVAPHYQRAADEGRTLIQSALMTDADIDVTAEELRITLMPQSSAHRTRAIAALCQHLTARAVRFPGSALRLHYRVADSEGADRTDS